MIPGGYVLKAKQIKKSNLHRQPPAVREIFDYLLREANYKDVKYSGFTVKRGQLFRTYRDIREDLCWYVGWRKEMYSENITKKAMKTLRELLMVETRRAPGGVLITVLNYNYYQDPKNYEGTKEGTTEGTNEEPSRNQCGSTNNNEKKEVKKDNNIVPPGEQASPGAVVVIDLIDRDGSFQVFKEDIDMWRDTFPGVDVVGELKKCKLWNFNNKSRRKTATGIRRHIATWLEKRQNKGGGGALEKLCSDCDYKITGYCKKNKVCNSWKPGSK